MSAGQLPPVAENGLLQRLAFKILRRTSSEHRAFTDLFVPPYASWTPWESGLGDAIFPLYGLMRALKPETIVEIGSARGRSTCALALACRQNGRGRVFAIDPHRVNDWTDLGVGNSTESFLRARLGDYELNSFVEIIRSTTAEAATNWNRQVDFLFIDGDHSLDGVRRDFETFRPWLNPDSLVAFHDTAWERKQPWATQKVAASFPDMGVPEYMVTLQAQGYHSVTLPQAPGLTILDPRPGGFPFLAGRSQAS